MANTKSAAAQAIKDMLELGMDITFFEGKVNQFHQLNLQIGIITKEKKEKQPKAPKAKPYGYTLKKKYTPTIRLNHSVVINPDGTVSLDTKCEWDYK